MINERTGFKEYENAPFNRPADYERDWSSPIPDQDPDSSTIVEKLQFSHFALSVAEDPNSRAGLVAAEGGPSRAHPQSNGEPLLPPAAHSGRDYQRRRPGPHVADQGRNRNGRLPPPGSPPCGAPSQGRIAGG